MRALIANWSDIDAENADGETALGMAVRKGRKSVVELLMDAGADVKNLHEHKRSLALLYAAEYNHVKMLSALLNAGVNVNEEHKGYRRTALTCAADKGHVEIVTLLLKGGA